MSGLETRHGVVTGPERAARTRLDECGVRFTAGRRRVVRALQRANGPRSAGELFAALGGGVPLSSLYRTLTVLEDADVVTPHHGARGITRYELSEWLTGHHHHLVCSECGGVTDVRLEESSEETLSHLVGLVSGTSGFAPAGHTLEIEGVCASCRR